MISHVITHQGLGDCIATRPTIFELAKRGDVYVETAWPEVFVNNYPMGSGVFFVKPRVVTIECGRRNVAAESRIWFLPPSEAETIQLRYTLDKGCKPIPAQIAESAGLGVVDWSRIFAPACCAGLLGVFRVPTIRSEYHNEARNPERGLVSAAVDAIGGDWLHVNDIGTQGEYEHELGPILRYAQATDGELSIPTCLDLVSRARCVVTPISWLAWAALMFQTPALVLWGGYCSPRTIFGPLLEDSTLKIVAPEPICECFDPRHQCEKSIPIERVKEWARGMK